MAARAAMAVVGFPEMEAMADLGAQVALATTGRMLPCRVKTANRVLPGAWAAQGVPRAFPNMVRTVWMVTAVQVVSVAQAAMVQTAQMERPLALTALMAETAGLGALAALVVLRAA